MASWRPHGTWRNSGYRGGFRSNWRDNSGDEELGRDHPQLRPGYCHQRGLTLNRFNERTPLSHRNPMQEGSRGSHRSNWRDKSEDENSRTDYQQLRSGNYNQRGLSSNRYNAGARYDHRNPVQENKRCVTDPPDHSFMAQAFKELAEIHSATSSIPREKCASNSGIILPYTDEDTRISFVNHYGNVFFHVLRFEPKVMSYTRAQSEGDTPIKIQSAIHNIVEELHRVTDDKYCCMELDFIKIVFTDPKPPLSFPKSNLRPAEFTSLIEDRAPELRQFLHRMCLNENEEALLDKLRGYGVELLEHHDSKDNYKVEVYSRGFEFDDHIYAGAIGVAPDDLTLTTWNVYRSTVGTCFLPNPGCEKGSHFQTEGGDLRLKGLASVKSKQKELEEMAARLNRTLPTYLTSPNLGGLLQKDGDSEFILQPNSGIVGLYVLTNRVKYSMSFNGIAFRLIVADMTYYRYDRETRSLVVDRLAKRWPKFKMPVPSKNENDVLNFVETFSDLITKLMNDLSCGEILPKIWSTNVITHGIPTPSIMIQNLRRRIFESETLRAILDLPPDVSEDAVMARYHKLLGAVAERRVILSDSAIAKLKAVARSEKVEFLESSDDWY